MISSIVTDYISECLRSAGFEPMTEYEDDIMKKPPAVQSAVYPAFMRVSQTALSRLSGGGAPDCRAEVTVKIRALGAKRGFADAEKLSAMSEQALSRLYLGSGMLVSRAVCGEVKRNMQLGRLEMPLEATLSYIYELKEVIE